MEGLSPQTGLREPEEPVPTAEEHSQGPAPRRRDLPQHPHFQRAVRGEWEREGRRSPHTSVMGSWRLHGKEHLEKTE